MEELPNIEKIVVEPNLILAYILHTLGDLIFLGAISGAYFGVIAFVSENIFLDALIEFNVPSEYALYGIIVFCILIFGATFFKVMSLTSYSVVFQNDSCTYSYGTLLKRTETIPIVNIAKVNFDQYKFLKTGLLTFEFSGTSNRELVIKYVDNVEENCKLINKLVEFKRSNGSTQ